MRGAEIEGSLLLELTWSIIPFLITIVMFVWATALFFAQVRVPDDAIQIDVVGKRWMWKLQHMTGQREITLDGDMASAVERGTGQRALTVRSCRRRTIWKACARNSPRTMVP